NRYTELRERYPYKSVEGRLPAANVSWSSQALPAVTSQRLAWVENQLESDRTSLRTRKLRELHESTVESFVRVQGFGIGRMISPDFYIRLESRREIKLPQPKFASSPSASPGDLDLASSPVSEPSLEQMFVASVLDFAFPEGFGFLK